MNVGDLITQLPLEARQRPYILRLDILELTASLIKARLVISPDLFIQVYRNDRFNSTNLVLILNHRRIFGRDQLGRSWHRHAASNPETHDRSEQGQLAVTLREFLNEAEAVMAELGLP